MGGDDFEGFVLSEAFGDAAGVESHAGLAEEGGLVIGVEGEELPAGSGAGFCQGGGVGELLLTAGATPESGEGAEGDVEEPVAGGGGELGL